MNKCISVLLFIIFATLACLNKLPGLNTRSQGCREGSPKVALAKKKKNLIICLVNFLLLEQVQALK